MKRNNSLTGCFSYRCPQPRSVLHLLQPFPPDWGESKVNIKCHPLCRDGKASEGRNQAAGREVSPLCSHTAELHTRMCRCGGASKASGGAAVETAGLRLCSCHYDLPHLTSILPVINKIHKSSAWKGLVWFYYYLAVMLIFSLQFWFGVWNQKSCLSEAQSQVLCLGELLSLVPKVQSDWPTMLAGEVFSGYPCSQVENFLLLCCNRHSFPASSSQILLAFSWLHLRIVLTAIRGVAVA